MNLTETTKILLTELETIIAEEAYNKHSYDDGCAYRYPVSVPLDENEKHFIKVNCQYSYDCLIRDKISLEQLHRMRYQFGANDLWIGFGITNLLSELENRYNLDFEELESQYQSNNLNSCFFTEEDCTDDEKYENKFLIRKLSEEDKKYVHAKFQLLYCTYECSLFVNAYNCFSGKYESMMDKDKIIGVASNKAVQLWKERYGEFNQSVIEQINV